MSRWFLGQDGSGHWYLVPADRRADWESWADLDEDDERAWQEPAWAERLAGHPSQVTFERPEVEP